MRLSSPRPLRALPALVLAGALFAGCAGGTGAADDQAASAALQYEEITGQQAMLSGVATAVSRADTVSSVMREHGVHVTDAEVESRIVEEGLNLPEGGLSEGSTKLWRSVYEFQDAAELPQSEQEAMTQDLSQALGQDPGTSNPRYAMTQEGYPLLPTWIATSTRASGGQQPAEQPAGHP